ncbi:[Fe-Fe] hydrogenase large subunit C-terminal domain-containing protein [Oceanispirochaeta sp.]|uniref:[Fe-Fe] hydrogenase large subunit C-terminal domain-containing protein n=1 Tax=Oceanispirochaeta sp. TaxID=2035350 RepID=UPI00262AF625|nr:[Fe-Fe] hydrogenase large subunit C-terminal domain-containing protein [Oceanispirochaeta sp.]MDA3957515.1 4Fe-4S dicluster domain-containing protein [Oceanispirochaeta sp.]
MKLNPIYTEITECQDCYKCIRHCPVKSIKVEDGHAKILVDDCILCGNCYLKCPVGAKKIRNDLPRAQRALQEHKKVILSLAPSFVGEFPGISPSVLIKGIKKLGFWAVSETALGAQEVSRHTSQILKKAEKGVFISSACPTMVEYIRKHKPQYSSYVIDHLSPLLTHCQMLKDLYGEDCIVIFAGPCISKKREADLREDLLHRAISFEDLKNWFSQYQIDLNTLSGDEDENFVPQYSYDGASYPLEGGMIRSLKMQNVALPDNQLMSFTNVHSMAEVLQNLESLGQKDPLFLELLACEGGCINGPGCGKTSGTAVKEKQLLDYITSREEQLSLYKPCSSIIYKRKIEAVTQRSFDEMEIRKALNTIGKYESSDEKNCGACGYSTCRDYAAAFLDGRAEKDMCVSYLKTLSEKKADALIKSMPSGAVIVDAEMMIIQCNRAFAMLIGEETLAAYETKPGLKGASLEKILPFTSLFQGVLSEEGVLADQTFHLENKIFTGSVFTIEKNQAVGGIFQDITLPWVQKDQVIKQARKVMENSISTVQQIAFLLGENAAQSEIMLNSIITSFGSESDQESDD